MGLDQYLYAKKHTYRPTEYDTETQKTVKPLHSALKEAIGSDADLLTGIGSLHVEMQVAYWRKANQIHNWFVTKCGNGKDTCQIIYVTRENLEELLALCKTVSLDKNSAETKLPTVDGFFFGSADYDEWYFEDVEKTIDTLTKVLTLSDEWEFLYQASW